MTVRPRTHIRERDDDDRDLPRARWGHRLRRQPARQEERRHQAAQGERGDDGKDQEERDHEGEDQERRDRWHEDPRRLGDRHRHQRPEHALLADRSPGPARRRRFPSRRSTAYPLGNATYTQNAGEDNFFIGRLEVNFAASCDAATRSRWRCSSSTRRTRQKSPASTRSSASGKSKTKGAGAVTRKLEFTPLPRRWADGAGLPRRQPRRTRSAFCSPTPNAKRAAASRSPAAASTCLVLSSVTPGC